MGVLTYGQQVVKQFSGGLAEIAVLYTYKNVNAGDTINLSSDFQALWQCVLIDVKTQAQGAATIAGLVITFPAGLTTSAGYMLVVGE